MKNLIQLCLLLLSTSFFTYCVKKDKVNDLTELLKTQPNNYVGESACIQCHQTEYNDWIGSHHDWSMKLPTKETMLGDFNNVTFEGEGEKYFFYQNSNGYFVDYTPENGIKKQYKVAYTFGVTPLQQYLIEFPDGKYQTLRATWDVIKKEWYNQYKGQQISTDDWLHWTKGGQNWNTMCAECHSTNLHKNYDPANDSFTTTYSIINVSCEACHGQGKAHVQWASKENPTGNTQIKVGGVGQTAQMNMCAGCHSRRVKLTEVMEPVKKYYNQFALQTINSEYYYPDGQIKEEDYVYGSFLQSKMYHNRVKCSDCHNIHSLKLKTKGNTLCLQCHLPTYNSPSHHFHESGTPSTECVSCHMIGKTYMGNDFRRDHSFRIPRPDQSIEYKTPNACTECHEDKSDQWAADWIVKWYGSNRADHFSDHLLKASRPPYSDEAKEEVIQFINNLDYPAIARAAAIEYYPSFSSENELKMLIATIRDSSALVRYYALNKLQAFPLEQRVDIALAAMNDSTKLLRTAAAWLIVELPIEQFPQEYHNRINKSNNELLQMLNANADFPLGRLRFGDYYVRKNNLQKAINEYEMALKMDSLLTPLYGNLATVYNRLGENSKALNTLTKLIKVEPEYARGYYLRGLLYNEIDQPENAAIDLKKALELDPDEFRYYYNLANLYVKMNSLEEALKVIESGLRINPGSSQGIKLENQIKKKQSIR